MLYTKIDKAKSGLPVTISPEELDDAQFDLMQPYTLADLITMCESFNLPYTLTGNSFSINPTGPVVETFLDDEEDCED